MKQSYNDDQHNGISNLLKSMPRIKAPDNFEYNLMTRIENKNFGDLAEEKKKLGFAWKLTPAVAFVTSLFILFMVWTDQSTEVENPLMKLPPTIAKTHSANNDVVLSKKSASKSDAFASRSVSEEKEVASTSDEDLYRVVVGSNDVVSREKMALNLNNGQNVDLDMALIGGAVNPNANNRTRLVGGGESFEFNGFYIREQTDRKMLEMIKNRLDSLNQARTDSIKNSTNLPR